MDDRGSGTRGSPQRGRRPSPAGIILPSRPTRLLSVAGRSPQVITETLYCLLVQRRPPVDVREVHVLTTRIGAEKVQEQLLRPRDGWLHRFCRDYGIPAGRIRCDAACLHVPEAADGGPLEDVRTPEENARIADAILALVRELTRDPAVALHASVAGGRKTMGLFLGIAFQLFARPQDRLSHVLVSPPELEGHPGFFYPPPVATTYEVGGKRLRPRHVRVELAEVPILLLREKVQATSLQTLPYTALIAEAQRQIDREQSPPRLVVDARTRSLVIGTETVRLTPLEFAVYSLFASRRVGACGSARCPGCERCTLEARAFLDTALQREILATLAKLGTHDERARTLPGWVRGADERFLQIRSRLNRKIRDRLGTGRWVAPYQIASRRSPGALTRYSLPLDPSRILLE